MERGRAGAGGPAPDPLRVAGRAARRAVRAHDENFPVAFALLERERREDMRAIYAYCRATDDIGDEAPGDARDRLAALDAWEAGLRRAVAGGDAPAAPLAAAARTIRRRGLPLDPFLRLIESNRIDQRRQRWDTYAELIGYCRHSATPVGRMVLGVLGHSDPWRVAMSDATCTGLQLVNLWQDVRRDRDERGRVYLPREDLRRFGVDEDELTADAAGPRLRALIRFETARAREWLHRGAPLARVVTPRARLDLRMFTAAGLALCDEIDRRDGDTLRGRPAPGRRGRARIAGRVLAGALRGAA